MKNMSTAFEGLVYKLAGDKYHDLVVVFLAWQTVVGDIMFEKSKIVKFENKTLFVKVANHVWMTEFVLNRPLFIKRIQEQTKVDIINILFTLYGEK